MRHPGHFLRTGVALAAAMTLLLTAFSAPSSADLQPPMDDGHGWFLRFDVVYRLWDHDEISNNEYSQGGFVNEIIVDPKAGFVVGHYDVCADNEARARVEYSGEILDRTVTVTVVTELFPTCTSPNPDAIEETILIFDLDSGPFEQVVFDRVEDGPAHGAVIDLAFEPVDVGTSQVPVVEVAATMLANDAENSGGDERANGEMWGSDVQLLEFTSLFEGTTCLTRDFGGSRFESQWIEVSDELASEFRVWNTSEDEFFDSLQVRQLVSIYEMGEDGVTTPRLPEEVTPFVIPETVTGGL